MRILSVLIILLLTLSLSGCKKEKALDPVAVPAALAKDPVKPASGGGGQEAGGLKGSVLETMESGGYSYMLLDTKGGKKWAAVVKTAVKVGQEITVANPSLMKDFNSKTLDRTFEEIYFGQLAGAGESHGGGAGGGAMPAGHPSMGGGGKKTSGTRKQPLMDVGDDLKKAEGPGGRTVAEVFGGSKDLGDKKVSIRAKVVKINRGILGSNWLHLQDGSGSAADGTHDLTVTSKMDAKQGEVVLVTGTVRLDKDFGAGYKYAVIVVDAEIKR